MSSFFDNLLDINRFYSDYLNEFHLCSVTIMSQIYPCFVTNICHYFYLVSKICTLSGINFPSKYKQFKNKCKKL